MFTFLTTILVTLALLLGGAGATAVAAQDANPDSPLYQVKLMTQQMFQDKGASAEKVQLKEQAKTQTQAKTFTGEDKGSEEANKHIFQYMNQFMGEFVDPMVAPLKFKFGQSEENLAPLGEKKADDEASSQDAAQTKEQTKAGEASEGEDAAKTQLRDGEPSSETQEGMPGPLQYENTDHDPLQFDGSETMPLNEVQPQPSGPSEGAGEGKDGGS